MFKLLAGGLALALALAATVLAQASDPILPPLWTLTVGFASPESAYFDAESNRVFVSSINGQILEKDGNGYISQLTGTGTVVSEKWVTGLNAPKGLRSVRGMLWVADIDEVVGIDIDSGRISSRVKIEGAKFLNDLATAPDGTVYVSDSTALKIFEVKNGTASVFVEGGDVVEQPNGLLVEGNRLILGTVGPAPSGAGGGPGGAPAGGHLFSFDRKTKQRTQLTMQPVGGIDGIESDGKNGLLVTDVVGARLLHVGKSGDVKVLAKFAVGGADFGYIPSRHLAVIPFLRTNTISAYDLTAALK